MGLLRDTDLPLTKLIDDSDYEMIMVAVHERIISRSVTRLPTVQLMLIWIQLTMTSDWVMEVMFSEVMAKRHVRRYQPNEARIKLYRLLGYYTPGTLKWRTTAVIIDDTDYVLVRAVQNMADNRRDFIAALDALPMSRVLRGRYQMKRCKNWRLQVIVLACVAKRRGNIAKVANYHLMQIIGKE